MRNTYKFGSVGFAAGSFFLVGGVSMNTTAYQKKKIPQSLLANFTVIFPQWYKELA